MNKEHLEEFNKRLKLEEEFRKIHAEAEDKIGQYITEAAELLEKALYVAEEYGVPMYFGITDVGQIYTPNSFKNKWGTLYQNPSAFELLEKNKISDSLKEIADLENFNDEFYFMTMDSTNYPGWDTSQICY